MRQRSFHEGAFAAAKGLLCSAVGFVVLASAPASVEILASARAIETVDACGTQSGPSIFSDGSETPGIYALNDCGNISGYRNLELYNDSRNQISPGKSSSLIAQAPPGLEILDANVPAMSLQYIVGTGYVAYFIWGTGSQRVAYTSTSFSVTPDPPATAFGFYLECNPLGTTCPADGAFIGMNQVVLTVQETVTPTIVEPGGSSNLWNQGSRWLRGNWPLTFTASAPSGIYGMHAWENGNPVDTSTEPSCWPDGSGPAQTSWQQCDNFQTWSPTVSLSGNGPQQLQIAAVSAAGNGSSPPETINVDSVQPAISLTGPSQASSSAGTAYVTATVTTIGKSGLGAITCSVDGGPAQSYSSSPASIPVSGLGKHFVQCTATNRSYNDLGQANVSMPAAWSLDIAEPTASGISFSNIIHSLKCRRVRERVEVAARWISVHRHGKLVRVHRPARAKVVKAVKCHARIVTRRVTVVVKEKKQGKTVLVRRRKLERVVLPPKAVSSPTKRVAYGKGATASGWLLTSSRIALPGRNVDVMTAPNNGLGQWTLATVATTNADGGWTAQLPAGPSRLVEALYTGNSTTLASTSNAIHLIVPAKVRIRLSTHRSPWGGTVQITGRVFGGHIPGGKLLRLRIGVAGVHETVGIPNVARNGRFRTTWKFASGSGVVRYWFTVSTLGEPDYAFAPGSSKRVYVTVGPG